MGVCLCVTEGTQRDAEQVGGWVCLCVTEHREMLNRCVCV